MGIATKSLNYPIHSEFKNHNCSSMSQDYHQAGIFSFSSNGFERSSSSTTEGLAQAHQEHQHHLAQQIRRDKLRVYEPNASPPGHSLVGIDVEESGGLPVYETAGMLSEMFNFPPGGPVTAAELLDQSSYHHHHNHNPHHHHQISGINANSAAAMQLFLMNPPQQRSPSPAPAPAPPQTSSTLHMLLPNPSSNSLQGFTGNFGATSSDHQISHPQFSWVHDNNSHHEEHGSNTVAENQGLSLSLSSSLQHLEAAKAEELRMGETGLLYYNHHQTGTGSSSSAQYFKNLSGQQQQQQQQALHLQAGVGVGVGIGQNHHQVHVGYGSSLGVVNVLRNSKYVKAAQELLEEFCSVGRGQFKKSKLTRQNTNPNSNTPGGSSGGGGGGGSSSSTKDPPSLSASDRIEHQRRKVKLLAMLDEVDRRYNHYCEQMQMVVNSFDLVMGFGAAVPYTALAQKAMSRHFRCLKEAIAAQLKQSCEILGEKDGAGSSGITKGETPRLRLLEQSLRQQRAFHQMGMMEQEAWRPQRGLPERSVNILRAWLFEHFLHPYPSDADKHLLARQTGLSRNQVSNWFINARVRLWKPMVEEMYQQESKDEDEDDDKDNQKKNKNKKNNNNINAQISTTTNTTATPTPSSSPTITSTAKRSEFPYENDPSTNVITPLTTATAEVAPPPPLLAPPPHAHHQNFHVGEDTCRRGSIVAGDYGTTGNLAAGADHCIIRFGTTSGAAAGDVSLTLGLRHAGNMPEKTNAFSVRDFGNC
ncbi:BEL1-like homeodomain protein 4 [Mercurialis annua]|uniref:BEL1-like homeodomain protein 4 n=1 Tax=Mercurialis annua TaxID=3986 RepID=UPI0021608FF0|nr:BEL1-like homeodomain protein 4 [Mercurialis annua]XP_050205988.1 BEL1-like homeodomain protein 4 [Mercurialis annua]